MQSARGNILVVDDELEIRDIFKESLEGSGYACHMASSGSVAKRVLAHRKVDLALVDIMMTGMSGLTLFEYIGENYPDVGVIFVTAMDDVNVAVRNLKLGAYDYLVKPVALRRLTQAVKEALDRRAAMQRELGPAAPPLGVRPARLDRYLGEPITPSPHVTRRSRRPRTREPSPSVKRASTTVEDMAHSRPAAQLVTTDSTTPDEVVCEGTVRLRVETHGDPHELVRFILGFRRNLAIPLVHTKETQRNVGPDAKPELDKIVWHTEQEVEIWLSLRRPLKLIDLLNKMREVCQISIHPQNAQSETEHERMLNIRLLGAPPGI